MAQITRRHATREERRAQVARLTLEGHTQAAIARQLGVSEWTVNKDVAAVRQTWREQAVMAVSERVNEELAVLAAMQQPALADVFDTTTDPRDRAQAIASVLRIMDHRAKLLGLYATDRVETLSTATVEAEIARLRRELEAQGVTIDVEELPTPPLELSTGSS